MPATQLEIRCVSGAEGYEAPEREDRGQRVATQAESPGTSATCWYRQRFAALRRLRGRVDARRRGL